MSKWWRTETHIKTLPRKGNWMTFSCKTHRREVRTGVLQSPAVHKWQYKTLQHAVPSWVSRHQCRWSLWCCFPCSKLCYWEIHPWIACLHFPSTPPAGNLVTGFSSSPTPSIPRFLLLAQSKKKNISTRQKGSPSLLSPHCPLLPSGKFQEHRAGGQAKDKNLTVSTPVPGTEHNGLVNWALGITSQHQPLLRAIQAELLLWTPPPESHRFRNTVAQPNHKPIL